MTFDLGPSRPMLIWREHWWGPGQATPGCLLPWDWCPARPLSMRIRWRCGVRHRFPYYGTCAVHIRRQASSLPRPVCPQGRRWRVVRYAATECGMLQARTREADLRMNGRPLVAVRGRPPICLESSDARRLLDVGAQLVHTMRRHDPCLPCLREPASPIVPLAHIEFVETAMNRRLVQKLDLGVGTTDAQMRRQGVSERGRLSAPGALLPRLDAFRPTSGYSLLHTT